MRDSLIVWFLFRYISLFFSLWSKPPRYQTTVIPLRPGSIHISVPLKLLIGVLPQWRFSVNTFGIVCGKTFPTIYKEQPSSTLRFVWDETQVLASQPRFIGIPVPCLHPKNPKAGKGDKKQQSGTNPSSQRRIRATRSGYTGDQLRHPGTASSGLCGSSPAQNNRPMDTFWDA